MCMCVCVYVCVGLFVLGVWGAGFLSFSSFWSFLASMLCTCIYIYRFGFFTTEALNQGKNKWLMAIMQSLGKYNLSCFASENQL